MKKIIILVSLMMFSLASCVKKSTYEKAVSINNSLIKENKTLGNENNKLRESNKKLKREIKDMQKL